MGLTLYQEVDRAISDIQRMMNRFKEISETVKDPEAKLADLRNETINHIRTNNSLENQIIRLRALIRSENMPELFDVNDDATTELAIEVAALEAELAKHEWLVIDPEDPGTWPEENKLWLFRMIERDENDVIYRTGQRSGPLINYRFDMRDATHYRRIVGPGGGESLPQKAHCESCEYEYIHNNRCSMCIGAHPGNDGYKSFYEKRNMELNK